MPVLIYDPDLESRIRTDREANPQANRYDEVWEGVLVVAPLPNNDHQRIVMAICYAIQSALGSGGGHSVLPGANVSDRAEGWLANYREPDVAAYLASNPAIDCGTHWLGGPDLAVEVVSLGERPWDKLEFYARVSTREVLIVNRAPRQLELHCRQKEKLVLLGTADIANAAVLSSTVLPLTFQLAAGEQRPTIVLTHTETKQTWTA